MSKSRYAIIFLLNSTAFSFSIAQVPLISFPDLVSITIYEQTGSIYQHTFNLYDPELITQLSGPLSAGNYDFEGWPGVEFYDVFYSDANGNFNLNGAYLSIEARFDLSTGGGGLNINEVEFHFGTGSSIYGRYISSFVSNGINYISGSEALAADCNLTTLSTMGNTQNTTLRLRVTIGLLQAQSTIIEEACSQSGYEIMVGSSSFNEDNAAGTEILMANDGCDSLV